MDLIYIIPLIIVLSAFMKYLLAQTSFGERAGFLKSKLKRIAIIEGILIIISSIPVYLIYFFYGSSLLLKSLLNLSDSKAIWYFDMIVSGSNSFYDSFVILCFTTPICSIFALLFPTLYHGGSEDKDSTFDFRKPKKQIFLGLQGFITPLIVIALTISILYFPSFSNGYDYNKLLVTAARSEYSPKLIRALLRKGADCNARENRYKHNDGWTALMLASSYGQDIRQSKIVKLLLNKGSDVNARGKDGKTALMLACKTGKFEIMKILLNFRADVKAKAKNGMTALMCVSRKRSSEYGQLLVNHGADVNIKDRWGRTSLMLASRGSFEMVKFLLSEGADINDRDRNGKTALLYAVSSGHDVLGIIKSLLERGADVNIKDKSGKTALMLTISRNENLMNSFCPDLLNRLKFLIDRGADMNVVDKDGKTILMLLCRKVPTYYSSCQQEVLKFLLNNGADINAKDNHDKTALMMTLKDQKAVKDLLIEYGARD